MRFLRESALDKVRGDSHSERNQQGYVYRDDALRLVHSGKLRINAASSSNYSLRKSTDII